jgi:hypothetical protein
MLILAPSIMPAARIIVPWIRATVEPPEDLAIKHD